MKTTKSNKNTHVKMSPDISINYPVNDAYGPHFYVEYKNKYKKK